MFYVFNLNFFDVFNLTRLKPAVAEIICCYKLLFNHACYVISRSMVSNPRFSTFIIIICYYCLCGRWDKSQDQKCVGSPHPNYCIGLLR